jgi:hypothetical protein
MTTTPLIDKDWDPEDLFSSHYDSLPAAACWMACAGTTSTDLADGTSYLDEPEDEDEDLDDDDPRADVEAYWYALHDGWVTP